MFTRVIVVTIKHNYYVYVCYHIFLFVIFLLFRFEKKAMATKLRLVKSTLASETATVATIPLPVAQMTPPSKVPHSPVCSSPESIDTGFYDVEVVSNLNSLNGDEYQLPPQQVYMPHSQQYEVKFEASTVEDPFTLDRSTFTGNNSYL